jgi:hypothetical protein
VNAELRHTPLLRVQRLCRSPPANEVGGDGRGGERQQEPTPRMPQGKYSTHVPARERRGDATSVRTLLPNGTVAVEIVPVNGRRPTLVSIRAAGLIERPKYRAKLRLLSGDPGGITTRWRAGNCSDAPITYTPPEPRADRR